MGIVIFFIVTYDYMGRIYSIEVCDDMFEAMGICINAEMCGLEVLMVDEKTYHRIIKDPTVYRVKQGKIQFAQKFVVTPL